MKIERFHIGGIEWPCVVPHKVFVGNPKSSVGICTLWKPIDKFANSIPENILENIGIIGQLLDPSGLNYMVRNLLANPRLKHLVVCGHDAVLEDKTVSEDRMSTRELLKLFFDLKTAEEVIREYIDESIPVDDVLNIIHNIQLIDLYKAESKQVVQRISRLEIEYQGNLWAPPKVYPYPSHNKNQIPILRSSTIVSDTIVDGYVLFLKNLLTYGVFQKRRKYPEGTLTGFSSKVVIKKEDPDNLFFDSDYLPPGCNKEYLERQYFPQVIGCKIADGEEYSYGSLLKGQVDYMVRVLLEDENSKDAVASLWNPEMHQNHNDPPCFVFAQVLILEDKLNFVCNMRSHNIIKCWPENAFAFRKLQGLIFNQLNLKYKDLKLGDLVVHSMSAQFNLNTKQKKIAESILEAGYKTIRKKYFAKDVINCFVFLDNRDIVLRIRSKGKVLREYRAKSARGMKNVMHLDGLDFLSDHAMYIGITLAEAEIALRMGLQFEQDKKLILGVGLDIDKSNGPIIAVDFDGVVHKYSEGWKDDSVYDEVITGTKEAIQQLKDMGFNLVIYSTRGNIPLQREEMEEYLNKHKIPYDLIVVGGKPYARYYVDDKAIRFKSWKQTLMEIKKYEKRRTDKNV